MLFMFTEKPDLTVLFQDDYFIAVDKPAGLFVHRSYLDRHEKYFALQLVRDIANQYVYPVHRLDRPTSGVLLFAKTEEMARLVSEDFYHNRVRKNYIALTRGFAPEEGLIDHPIKIKLDKIGDKHSANEEVIKEAQTNFTRLNTAQLDIPLGKYNSVRYSLLSLAPKTGRRHQIRKHLSHLRHPIIGDINYGDNKQNPFFAEHFGFKRLMLMAKSLCFYHPVLKEEILVEARFDPQWLAVFERLNWSFESIEKALGE